MLHRFLLVVPLAFGSSDALARQVDGARQVFAPKGLSEDDTAQDELLELLVWQLEEGDLEATRAVLTEILEPGARTLVAHRGEEEALTVLESLDAIAQRVGDLDATFAVKTEIHRRLDSSLSPDDSKLLAAKEDLAAMLEERGDLEGARALDEQVHSAWEQRLPQDHPTLLRAKHNLAATRRRLGDLDGALALQEHVYSARKRLLDSGDPNLLMAKGNLAVTRKQLGDLEGALVLEEHVHAAWERLLDPGDPKLLKAKSNLALTRRLLGDLEGALALQEYVHSAWQQLVDSDDDLLLAAKGNLAQTRAELGDREGALALEEQVHAAREQLLGPNHPDLLLAKQNLASALGDVGDLERALALEEYVHASRERFLEPGHPDVLTIKYNLALTRYQLDDRDGALELSASLADAASEFVASGLAASPREARATARTVAQRLAKGRIWCRSQRVPEADLESYMRAFETTRHVATARFELGSGVDLEGAQLAELRGAVAAAKRAIDEHMTRAPYLPDRVQGQPEKVWKQARDASQAEWNRRLGQLSMDRDACEKELLAVLGGSRSLVTSVDPALFSAALKEGDVAVGLHRIGSWEWGTEGKDRTYAGECYVAYAIGADGGVAEIDLGSAAKIDALIERWRSAMGTSLGSHRGFGTPTPVSATASSSGDLEAGRALRRILLDPLVEASEIQFGARMYVCFDDALHAAPLDALPLEADVDRPGTAEVGTDVFRVGDVYDIRTEVSFARLIAPDLSAETPDSVLLVGGVDYSDVKGDVTLDSSALEERVLAQATRDDRAGGWGSWSALDGASEEVAQIGGLAQAVLEVEPATLTADAVTAASLATGVVGKTYVHIATHGWFMPETVRSMLDHDPRDERMGLFGTERAVTGFAPMSLCGLVLSGANAAKTPGQLAEGLLTAMELSTFHLSDCELAVLSACETNVGIARAGQGIQSLQTALHQAGARASVTSLWRVDDEATRDLMRAFYANLWEKGMGKAEALWDAKCQMRRRGEPVRHWAGWVLVGNPE